uniref:Uncharacterized protein n=1 Tax=Siphoviridae sp. ctTC45 TaxID=2827573 RepID=A0A8S5LQS4_9CAUD|nr:MAG TPA: hypothetical protein [Siphoviridae sp. ctTC45]DAV23228.1 MAG TPA: hypothetical protein [Caudoviricetes sp.]
MSILHILLSPFSLVFPKQNINPYTKKYTFYILLSICFNNYNT